MEQNLIFGVFMKIILYGLDGIVWLYSVKWILTGFYGYPAKSIKHQKLLFAAVIIFNDLMMVGIYYYNRANNVDYGFTYPLVFIFCIIYWMFTLQERSKIKRILAIIFSANLLSEIFIWISGIRSLLPFKMEENVMISLIGTLIQQGFILLFMWLLGKLSSRYRKEPMRFSLVVTSAIACVLLDMLINLFVTDQYGELHPLVSFRLMIEKEYIDSVIGFSIFIFAFILLIIFFIMLIRESESDYFQKKNTINEYYLETQKNHYESLIQTNREIRKIKHDMKNHIFCLQELCRKKQYKEIEKYLGQIEENFTHVESDVKIGNEIADAILSDKIVKAKEKKITFTIDGVLYDVGLKAIDICTIFANMTDNAIEAVEKLPENKRSIDLSIRKNKNYLLISERNPMLKKLEIVDNTVFTTKKERSSHGFGIINIKDALAKYDGECVIQIIDKDGTYWFQMDLMIPM